MLLEIIFLLLLLSNIGAFINSRKDQKYIKELESENNEQRKLLALPKNLQFKTINKAYKLKKLAMEHLNNCHYNICSSCTFIIKKYKLD